MATSSTGMGKIMRAWPWFAALCVSLGTAAAHGADGLDLALRTHGAITRFADPGAAPLAGLREGLAPQTATHAHDGLVWLVPLCREGEGCRGAAEGRLLLRGARRYMPSWDGLAPEGISLRRDRLVLRYSFR